MSDSNAKIIYDAMRHAGYFSVTHNMMERDGLQADLFGSAFMVHPIESSDDRWMVSVEFEMAATESMVRAITEAVAGADEMATTTIGRETPVEFAQSLILNADNYYEVHINRHQVLMQSRRMFKDRIIEVQNPDDYTYEDWAMPSIALVEMAEHGEVAWQVRFSHKAPWEFVEAVAAAILDIQPDVL